MPKIATVKALLQSGGALSTRDIADLARCSIRFVNQVRQDLKAYQNGASVKQNLQRLDQDVKDLRALVLHLAAGQKAILGQLADSSKPKRHGLHIAS